MPLTIVTGLQLFPDMIITDIQIDEMCQIHLTYRLGV